jgi:hypothetical protein
MKFADHARCDVLASIHFSAKPIHFPKRLIVIALIAMNQQHIALAIDDIA